MFTGSLTQTYLPGITYMVEGALEISSAHKLNAYSTTVTTATTAAANFGGLVVFRNDTVIDSCVGS